MDQETVCCEHLEYSDFVALRSISSTLQQAEALKEAVAFRKTAIATIADQN
jgi:hypothetical protein